MGPPLDVTLANVVTDHNSTSLSVGAADVPVHHKFPTKELEEFLDDDDVESQPAELDGIHLIATTTIYRVVLPVVCAFGILGILLTLIVLSRKTMRTSTNCYLMALSVADLIFLVLLASTLVDAHIGSAGAQAQNIFFIYATYAVILTNVCLLASVWLTVMLAVERYIAICQPFLAARLCTVRISAAVIAVIFSLATICRLPNFWESRVGWYRDPGAGNISVPYIEMTSFAYEPTYLAVYPWVVDGVLTSMAPFLALVVLNASLVREVRRSTRYLQRMHHSAASATTQREELQISVMLIGIVIVFFICQAPYVVYTAVMSIRRFLEPTPSLTLFRHLAVLLLVLKSAVNFIVYCWFSEKFWTTFKRVFHCMTLCERRLPRTRRSDSSYCSVRVHTTAIQMTAI